MRFCARVQGDLNQAGSRRIGRCEDASARGIADLRGTATVEATDRSASDGRAFAPQAVAPMRRTRHFWQTRQRSHRGRFDVQPFPVRKFSRDDPIATGGSLPGAAVPLLISGGVKLEVPYQPLLLIYKSRQSSLAYRVPMVHRVDRSASDGALSETARDTSAIGNRDSSSPQPSESPLSAPQNAGNQKLEKTKSHRSISEQKGIFGLGIRSAPEGNAMAFTSINAVLPQPASTRTISQIADGGGWRSSIILVNTDTVPAAFRFLLVRHTRTSPVDLDELLP